MDYAWTAHVSFTTTDESLTYRARRRIRQICKWYSQWNERDTCAVHAWYEGGRQWTDVNVRDFESVPTHKHWRPTRVPRKVTHTRRMNNAHRRTVVRRKYFEPFKTQNHAQLTINDGPRSIHRQITHTTRAPCRNETICVIRAWFMRFRYVTGPSEKETWVYLGERIVY